MKIRYLITLLLALVLTTACGVDSTSTIEPAVTGISTEAPNNNAAIQTPVPVEALPSVEAATPPNETAAPNCLGDEVSPIGQSIVEDYESATYEQIMTWFCNGAEFEDILVALETEEQTDASADEMLKMLADGFTWDEIWQIIGLTD